VKKIPSKPETGYCLSQLQMVMIFFTVAQAYLIASVPLTLRIECPH